MSIYSSCIMSANTNEISNINNLLINFERQFHQLLLESKSKELIIKTAQENLNNCLKRCTMLEHELETERLNKSLIKMELDTLITINDNYIHNINNSEIDINILVHDQEYLTNKIFITQNENKELKQELTKSNGQMSSLKANQFKFSQQVNLITSMFNSLQEEIKILKNESLILVNILSTVKNLAKKMVCAFKYTKNSNKVQFEYIQLLLKEVATIKSNIYMFVNKQDNQQIIKSDEINTILLNQFHLELSKELVEALEAENNTLYKSAHQIIGNKMFKNDTTDTK